MVFEAWRSAHIEVWLLFGTVLSAATLLVVLRSVARIAASPVAPVEKELPLMTRGLVGALALCGGPFCFDLAAYVVTENRVVEALAACCAGAAIYAFSRAVSPHIVTGLGLDRTSRKSAFVGALFLILMVCQLMAQLTVTSADPTFRLGRELLIAGYFALIPASIAMYALRFRYESQPRAASVR